MYQRLHPHWALKVQRLSFRFGRRSGLRDCIQFRVGEYSGEGTFGTVYKCFRFDQLVTPPAIRGTAVADPPVVPPAIGDRAVEAQLVAPPAFSQAVELPILKELRGTHAGVAQLQSYTETSFDIQLVFPFHE